MCEFKLMTIWRWSPNKRVNNLLKFSLDGRANVTRVNIAVHESLVFHGNFKLGFDKLHIYTIDLSLQYTCDTKILCFQCCAPCNLKEILSKESAFLSLQLIVNIGDNVNMCWTWKHWFVKVYHWYSQEKGSRKAHKYFLHVNKSWVRSTLYIETYYRAETLIFFGPFFMFEKISMLMDLILWFERFYSVSLNCGYFPTMKTMQMKTSQKIIVHDSHARREL